MWYRSTSTVFGIEVTITWFLIEFTQKESTHYTNNLTHSSHRRMNLHSHSPEAPKRRDQLIGIALPGRPHPQPEFQTHVAHGGLTLEATELALEHFFGMHGKEVVRAFGWPGVDADGQVLEGRENANETFNQDTQITFMIFLTHCDHTIKRRLP